MVLASCLPMSESYSFDDGQYASILACALTTHLLVQIWVPAAFVFAILERAWRGMGAVSCKMADDPSFTAEAHWLLGCLCQATRILQTPQFALPRDLARLMQEEGSDDELEDDVLPQDVAVTFAILAPEYAPEFVTVVLQLPCTWEEAELLVPAARTTAPGVRFPHVRPVSLQHTPGFAILTAAPRWDPSAFAPSYIDYEGLCWMAALPSGLDYDVYVDGDDQPLVRDQEIQSRDAGCLCGRGAPRSDRLCACTAPHLTSLLG